MNTMTGTMSSAGVTVTELAPTARISLRMAGPGTAGLALPSQVGARSGEGRRTALCLGPDEWLLIGPDGVDFVALAGQSGALHSAVDVSHRNVAFVISGPGGVTPAGGRAPSGSGS